MVKYEAVASIANSDEWQVVEHGEFVTSADFATFIGPRAKERAEEYAEFKNAQPVPQAATQQAEGVIVWLDAVRELERRLGTPAVSSRSILERLGLDHSEEMARIFRERGRG